MRTFAKVLWIGSLLACAASRAGAAEIVLEQTAVQKLVQQSLFKDKGRLMLMRGGCEVYLEKPVVTLTGDRIQVVSHLAGRIGASVDGHCVGMGVKSDTKLSGKPVAAGGSVRLQDIHVDDVSDPTIRSLLMDSGLSALLPSVVDLDVQAAVARMLAQVDQVQATVDSFSFQDVAIAGDRLRIAFEFKLIGR